MKFVNRGYMIVKPTNDFVEWANSVENGIKIHPNFIEGNVYLIEEDFMETEPILKSNFKKIFSNEFEAVTDDQNDWPCDLKMENFEKFFKVDFGSTVFDTLGKNLRAD